MGEKEAEPTVRNVTGTGESATIATSLSTEDGKLCI